ncbi:hypothetical protein HOP50_04g35230 [Chloropicon primus]|uniref:Uncharacterized protein n=1 Tax=Chloropicon primus TaxID=1764295 RepID=A0A5B8MK44_9CHLO|nr:hypothetical protein A3770_04p35160 [Chloropicon primus]UPR00209.1 hypothetical protein HOP50_04g35230 [Chloropicon primus]|eukprot:QDZ20998.1 hypothetical protein A3770_04p35160 [Chloropicon primus]
MEEGEREREREGGTGREGTGTCCSFQVECVSCEEGVRRRERKGTCERCVREVFEEFEAHLGEMQGRRGELKARVAEFQRVEAALSEQQRARRAAKRKRDRQKERQRRLRREVEEKKRENDEARRRLEGARGLVQRLREEIERITGEGRPLATLRRYKAREEALRQQLTAEQRKALKRLLQALPLELRVGVDSRDGKRAIKGDVKVCGLSVPLALGLLSKEPAWTAEKEQEVDSALGYLLLLLDLASRILGYPVLHVTGLDMGLGSLTGCGSILMGFGVSHSTIWQPKSYWQLMPSSESEELPLYLHTNAQKSSSLDQASILGVHALAGISGIPSASGGDAASLARENAEAKARFLKGVDLLQRSVGVVCGHFRKDQEEGGEARAADLIAEASALSAHPLVLLVELCSHFASLDLVKSSTEQPVGSLDSLSVMGASTAGSVLESSAHGRDHHHTALGMEFSVISKPREEPKAQDLEDWDVVDKSAFA